MRNRTTTADHHHRAPNPRPRLSDQPAPAGARGGVTRFLAAWAAAGAIAAALYTGIGCASTDHAAQDQTAMQAYVQGVMAYQRGDNDKAMADFESALRKDGQLVMARTMLGDLYRLKGDEQKTQQGSQEFYENARQQYETVAGMDPYNYAIHYRLGIIYQFLNQFHESIASCLRALNLNPDHAGANRALGTAYMCLADPADKENYRKMALEAAKYLERASVLDPTNAEGFKNLGIALDAAREYPRAEAAYRKALDLGAERQLVSFYLGENLLAQKKYAEARSVLAEMVKSEDAALHDNPERRQFATLVRKRYGDAYAGEGNFDEAVTQYRLALKLSPEFYPALNEIGGCYIKQYEKGLTLDDSKRTQALDAWRNSLAIERSQPRIEAQIKRYSKAATFTP